MRRWDVHRFEASAARNISCGLWGPKLTNEGIGTASTVLAIQAAMKQFTFQTIRVGEVWKLLSGGVPPFDPIFKGHIASQNSEL